MIFQLNLKCDQNLESSGSKCTLLITTKFCTCHGSVTVWHVWKEVSVIYSTWNGIIICRNWRTRVLPFISYLNISSLSCQYMYSRAYCKKKRNFSALAMGFCLFCVKPLYRDTNFLGEMHIVTVWISFSCFNTLFIYVWIQIVYHRMYDIIVSRYVWYLGKYYCGTSSLL